VSLCGHGQEARPAEKAALIWPSHAQCDKIIFGFFLIHMLKIARFVVDERLDKKYSWRFAFNGFDLAAAKWG
jgi:hypothetical protein